MALPPTGSISKPGLGSQVMGATGLGPRRRCHLSLAGEPGQPRRRVGAVGHSTAQRGTAA